MSEEKFQDAAALEAWLIGKKVPKEYAEAAAPSLYLHDFFYPSALIDTPSADLKAIGLTTPVSQSLSNLLAKDQQPDGKLRC
jgi:hypothetical protein